MVRWRSDQRGECKKQGRCLIIYILLMISEVERHNYNLGQNVDVKDTKNKWVNGEIVYIKGSQLYIHYSGWSSKYDEYIDMNSDRLLTQWEPGKDIRINNRIDAYHPSTGWLEARVVDIEYQYDANPLQKKVKKVLVHYFNYHPRYDRWVNYNDPSEMAIIGSRSKAYGIGQSRLNKKSQNLALSELAKKILEIKVKKMIEQLGSEDYIVKQIAGDGNCLFRSVSDQLYGSQQYHKQIRQLCLKYILDQRAFFQSYITEDLETYVSRKSQDGVWGDDVEIEALSQIYGRPIQIYSTSSKPLRTFHQDNEHQIEPLRLAYLGFCHYNSIKKKNESQRGLLDTPFGDYEAIFSAAYTQKGNNFYSNISRYRELFSNSNAIDCALSESVEASEKKEDFISERLNEFQIKELNQALEISETENILQQIQKSQIQQVQTKIEQEQLQEELRKIQERQLQIAKEMSKKVKKDVEIQRPYWFQDLLCQGFTQKEIQFAIEINGYDPDRVQNFLLDNM